jgi:hypothetical protein
MNTTIFTTSSVAAIGAILGLCYSYGITGVELRLVVLAIMIVWLGLAWYYVRIVNRSKLSMRPNSVNQALKSRFYYQSGETLLQKGISGTGEPLFRSSAEEFFSTCRDIASSGKSPYIDFTEGRSDPMANFHYGFMKSQDGKMLWVLCNHHYPVVSFCSSDPKEDWENFSFSDTPELKSLFAPKYRVATESELNAPIEQDHLNVLAAAERQEIRYWEAKRVGDIIFHYWD